MKNFFLILLAFMIMQPVIAKNVKVEALSDFSTENPPSVWRVKVIEGFIADSGFIVRPNSIIEGRIEDVISPKRLKRSANFTFIPQTYYDPKLGYTQDLKQDIEGKYSALSDVTAKSVAKQGAVTAGNILIGSFVGPGVALIEGAVKNEEGNRTKSAAISVYENSPLSYVNKGKELEFKKGQIFIMNFKLKEEDIENKPNYSYEME